YPSTGWRPTLPPHSPSRAACGRLRSRPGAASSPARGNAMRSSWRRARACRCACGFRRRRSSRSASGWRAMGGRIGTPPAFASRSWSTARSASRASSIRRPAAPTGSGSTSRSICPARPDARSRSCSRPTSRARGRRPACRGGAASGSSSATGASGSGRIHRGRASSSCSSTRSAPIGSAATGARRARARRSTRSPPPAAAVNDVFLRWLRSNRARRFLAYLHYMEPHHPYTPPPHLRPPAPPGVRRRVAAGRLDPWQAAMRAPIPFQLPALELEYVRRLYEGEIRAWDEQLAELLRALDAFDLLRSTVVVVTADHGEAFQEHGRLQHGFHLYDELLRVPLVIAGPGIGVGRVSAQTMGIDV